MLYAASGEELNPKLIKSKPDPPLVSEQQYHIQCIAELSGGWSALQGTEYMLSNKGIYTNDVLDENTSLLIGEETNIIYTKKTWNVNPKMLWHNMLSIAQVDTMRVYFKYTRKYAVNAL